LRRIKKNAARNVAARLAMINARKNARTANAPKANARIAKTARIKNPAARRNKKPD